jgi:hypothetical protein
MTPNAQPAAAYPRLTLLPDPPKSPDAVKQRRHVARAFEALGSRFQHQPDVLVSGEG